MNCNDWGNAFISIFSVSSGSPSDFPNKPRFRIGFSSLIYRQFHIIVFLLLIEKLAGKFAWTPK